MANPILKRLLQAGFPESTAKKIASGELDMSLSARNARMREQGYDPTVTYHYGPKGIQEFKLPTDNRKYKFGPGVYSSPRPEYGERYLAMRGINPEDAEAYHLVSRGKMASDNVMNDLHYEAVERGGSPASKDYWSGMQDALRERGYTGLDFMGERNVFDPANIRDVNRAAFDPDQVGNPNILASAAPVAAGGLLAALGMAPQEAEAGVVTQGMKAFSDKGQQLLDRVLNKTSLMDLPADAELQGFQSNVFRHGGRKGIESYDLDAPRLNAISTPEGLYTGVVPEKAQRYIKGLKEKGIDGEMYDLVTNAQNVFVRGVDKPNKAMIDAYENYLKKEFGSDTRYIDSKLSEFSENGNISIDMNRKARSDIYRAGGADALLDGEDMVFLDPSQTRSTEAKFDPMRMGENNWLAGAAPVAAGGILGALGLPENATAADVAFAGKSFDKGQAREDVQSLILESLLGPFMPNTVAGEQSQMMPMSQQYRGR